MPVNRNALIRYRTLDNCLRNRYRQWTLEDLIEACSEGRAEHTQYSQNLWCGYFYCAAGKEVIINFQSF